MNENIVYVKLYVTQISRPKIRIKIMLIYDKCIKWYPKY